ncbi:MAG TPA: hypothetical protein VNL69_13205, partial [Bacteroidota bacterium]|nr:hypothetical protein [Bacteroidota bacterium]
MAVYVLAVAVFLPVFAQEPSDDDVLARVGSREITVGEFRQRIDLMPWPGKENPQARDSAKIAALASLVAEKLLAQQAVEQGMALNPTTSASLAAIERLLARNELYRTEAAERVRVDSAEIVQALARYALLLRLNVFVVSSQHRAEKLAACLSSADSAVSLDGVLSHDTVVVGFGDLHPAYEDAAYALGREGEARAAFTERYGWAVLQLLERATNPAYARQGLQDRLLTVEQKLRRRKEGLLAIEFARRILSKSLHLDSSAFHILADSLHALMVADSADRQGEVYVVRGDEVDRLRQQLAPFLRRTFAWMGDDSVTLDEIVGELKFFPLRFGSLRKSFFLRALSEDMRLVIEAALMSHEALRRNMHQRPVVRREMAMWIDAMQAEKLLKFLLDSLAR